MVERQKADANPTKAFFVRMITRDIPLEDCILDLIDNSVDGAWKLQGGLRVSLSEGTELSTYVIEIAISTEEFTITDNCGGITLDDAARYAFTFGRKDDMSRDRYSIGVYGIGMKRAVFKMGSTIKVESTYRRADGAIESFAVPISVPKWLTDQGQSWDFDIADSDALPKPGARISVTDLNEATENSFGNPAFIQNLKRTIARDYALHLYRGLVVRLNGEDIRGWQIEMRRGGDFEPMRIEYKDEDGEGEHVQIVNVELLAGMTAPPPESSEPDSDSTTEDRSGWYVVCNGRIVVAADKSSLVGWGTDGWPQWHPQYSGFFGLLIFTAEDAALLPLTTTKRSVDTSAGAFRRARPRMREASKQWIAYTNRRKETLDEARKIEALAKPLPIFAIPQRQSVALPTLTARPREKTANINYVMPLSRVRKLADSFGNINMTYRDIGIKSFEYAYSDKVGEG